MRFLPGGAARSPKVGPRAQFERRLRTAEFTVLGVWFVAAVLLFMSPNFTRSRLQAEEATRAQDRFVVCQAIEQYTHDRQTAPESFDDLIQFKYLSTIPVDPVTHEKLLLPDCVGGPEEYMDPVETIPGFRHLYSCSTDTSGKRSYF